MSDVDRLEAIAQALETKAEIVPSVAEKRDVSKEAKLRRIGIAIAAIDLDSGGGGCEDCLTDAPIDGTQYGREDGAWTAVESPPLPADIDRSKTFTLNFPQDGDDFTMFFTERAITVTEIRAVRTGGTDIDFTIYHGAVAHATTNTLVAQTGTSDGAGNSITSFDDATIPADSFVSFVQGTTSGTPTEISITVFFEED